MRRNLSIRRSYTSRVQFCIHGPHRKFAFSSFSSNIFHLDFCFLLKNRVRNINISEDRYIIKRMPYIRLSVAQKYSSSRKHSLERRATSGNGSAVRDILRFGRGTIDRASIGVVTERTIYARTRIDVVDRRLRYNVYEILCTH